MAHPEPGRTGACGLKRKVRFAFSVTILSAALAACGGGGDDSSAAAAPSSATPPVVSDTSSNNGGGAVASGSGTSTSGSSTTDGGPAAGGGSAAGDGDVIVASVPGTTTLSWIPPTMNEDGTPLSLTGYRIYWGQQKDYFTSSVTLDNPGLTRYVVEQLEPAKYYFVATALSERGESEFSNVIAMQIL